MDETDDLPLSAGKDYHHTCPKCGSIFGCDWRAIALLDQQAHRLKTIAGLWRARLTGAAIGRPRKWDLDVEAARELAATGLSLRAISRALGGAPPGVIHRALKGKRAATGGGDG